MKFSVLLLGLCLAFPLLAQDSQDSNFLIARDAFRAGDRNKLERASSQLGNHELLPYVENYRLRMYMDQGDSAALRGFFERYEKSYVVEKLRADWIRWLGKRSTWNEVEREYAKMLAPEPDIICYSQQARLFRGDRSVFDEAEKLWLTMLEAPEACRTVFDALIIGQRLSGEDVWARVHRQLEANRPAQAKTTLAYLPDNEAPDSKSLDNALNNAMSYLVRQPANWYASRAGRELAVIAIQRIASNDPQAAADQLEKIKARLNEPERQWAWSQIALQGAKRHSEEAITWYANAGKTALSDEGHQWKVRAALRALEWGGVRDAILAMPPTLAALPEWIYWLGRAHKAGGRTSEADTLFEKIAGQANFYGNLADEELGRTVMPPPRALPPTAAEQKAARDNPGIRRALAFFRLDMRTEAVKEWNWSLRGMEDRELLAVADIAKRNQIWDRAINTADRTKTEHDYTLRFLAPYGEQVRPAAQNQSLDDAWVYGLMRQESRFITGAKSNVGASGLMQLMPATAKWVAKKIGLRDYNHGRVNDTEINVLLGTSYMRLVMENLDNHPVLASAAYNAGPGRAKKWRAARPLEGAIYAETIPFSETRDYVKKVMSNAVYYSALFNGKPDSLKTRLGTVGGRTADAMKDADLP
ncbi:lytic transglycosylase domain-containing protein [Dechloromonas denitrificans]|uniref:lytic transglycosylase domain-containing protein n=1 Tax=Dechloromonas denitrificans TaxID=281362 RepID=UPI001CF87505|nr:lytic transglycosylase domain-containing protein [Dechloromonas denitrificans]UCV03639.1 lytic transglycosylase domain-containing protein [Dechloromonas denitrificans]UCV07899.1 lytic transglycosylase domain-containing protein [Dechloromonas denitrificans]